MRFLANRGVEDVLRLASGSNGLPFSMPIERSRSIMTLSRSSHGSRCTMRWSDAKNDASYGIVASNSTPDASTNVVGGGADACDSG